MSPTLSSLALRERPIVFQLCEKDDLVLGKEVPVSFVPKWLSCEICNTDSH